MRGMTTGFAVAVIVLAGCALPDSDTPTKPASFVSSVEVFAHSLADKPALAIAVTPPDLVAAFLPKVEKAQSNPAPDSPSATIGPKVDWTADAVKASDAKNPKVAGLCPCGETCSNVFAGHK